MAVLTACSVTTELGAGGIPDLPSCASADARCGGCISDHSCASGICERVSAMCQAPAAIAYVSPSGDGDACTQANPCGSLAAAAAVLTPTRRTVLLAPGTYGSGAAFGHEFPVELHGDGAVFIGGEANLTISALGPANLMIRGLEVSTQGTAFSCRDGATLRLESVRVQSDLGVSAAQCALTVRDATFYDGVYGIYVENEAGGEDGHVEISASSFSKLAGAVLTANTSLTLANVLIENVGVGVLAEAYCPGLQTCVTITDSTITGASTRAVELRGSGFLFARNQVRHNPSGGLRATARVVRLESNVIAHNGALARAASPGISLDDIPCFGCTRQLAVVGNTVAHNQSNVSHGAGLLSGPRVAPVLASNIVAYNTGLLWGASQIQCEACTSYQDLIEPANVGGATRLGTVAGAPQFADAATGDFHIQATSPAQDAGMCAPPLAWMAAITADVDGHARSQPCDVGAYETP